MPTERLTFPGAQGGQLAARLELPDDRPPIACAVFAHCFTCSKDSRAAVTISRSLAALGIAVLRFDFTGLGESDGDFGETTYSGSVADLIAAARFLATRFDAPSLLIGHSLGGAAAIRAAASLPSVTAVVTIGAPFDPGHALHLFEHAADDIDRDGSAPVTIAGRTFHVSRALVEDLRESTLSDAVRDLNRALLIMHAPADEIVPVEHAARLYTAARHPKSFVSLDTADHLLTQTGDAEYAAAVLCAWASRYIRERPAAHAAPTAREDVGAQALARTGATSGYRTDMVVGGHTLMADEPVAVGGGDAGPAPFDLLSAALAACTTMTLQLYARRKGWPLERAIARVSHEKVANAAIDSGTDGRTDGGTDGGTAVTSRPGDRFLRQLQLEGPLDADQRARLLQIAGMCPVHRTLTGGAAVETTIRPD